MINEVIVHKNNQFILNTAHTTYAFRVNPDCGLLEHVYYGRKIHLDSFDGLMEQHAFAPGNTINYENGQGHYSLEDMCLEFSTLGKGDVREPMIEAILSDGSRTLDLKFDKAETFDEKKPLQTLPSSYDEKGDVKQLRVVMKDKDGEISVELLYTVFPSCDVITKSVILKNEGSDSIRLTKCLSNMIDFADADFTFTTFQGAWAREMRRVDAKAYAGKIVNESNTGTSSNRSNPFVMLSKENTTEDCGDCYGFNLVYSGNHYESVSVNAYGKTRFLQGINPQGFEFLVGPKEHFEAPEAVMSFSCNGFNSLSHNMHDFVNEHIVRGSYKKKVRPVLLNSWEAAYFDIKKKNILELAEAAKEVGIELFVMDDGWFGQRDDDTKSLGDWDVNEKKIPGGLEGLSKKITELGLMFGIWVEPEMVNVDSELYKAHPDWVIDIPGREHSEGRNQRILDLCNSDVQDFIIEKMTEVFTKANVSYVKWDMNRIFSDVYSKSLPANRQGEVLHRYVLGLYSCMGELTKRFPEVLFEGCASGGNRFDLGILCYFPQIWASDNTDAMCRTEIQNGYSYGYPQSTYTAHVSGVPNHQTLRKTPLETRFNVASFGILGYEFNLCELSKSEKEAIKEQVELYKKWRDVLQFGNFYRGEAFAASDSVLSPSGNTIAWTIVSNDQSKAVGVLLQKMVCPNAQYHCYKASGLKEDTLYHFTSRAIKHDIREFGNLVNTVSPIHIKQDSLAHNVIAHFVKMDSATEDYEMYGDALMYSGVKLKQAFSGTGYDDNVRFFQDFSSEMLFMETM